MDNLVQSTIVGFLSGLSQHRIPYLFLSPNRVLSKLSTENTRQLQRYKVGDVTCTGPKPNLQCSAHEKNIKRGEVHKINRHVLNVRITALITTPKTR